MPRKLPRLRIPVNGTASRVQQKRSMRASAQAIAGQGALAGLMLALTMPPKIFTSLVRGGGRCVLHAVASTHLAQLVPAGHGASG